MREDTIRGRYGRTVDAKWRVMIPGKWRFDGSFYITSNNQKELIGYPSKLYLLDEDRCFLLPESSPERINHFSAIEAHTDDAGRMTVPIILRKDLGFSERGLVILLGNGNGFIIRSDTPQEK